MWKIKQWNLDQEEEMQNWIAKNESRIQWHEVFINNALGIEYRMLRII